MQRLMIVDDEPEILNPLQSMLEAEGYRIDAFGSPLKAISHLKRNEIALAICDIKMPEMSGYDLLKELRVIKSNLPVIFLSSKDEEQDQIIGFTLGADDYVTKPFSVRELILRVKAMLKRGIKKSDVVEVERQFGDLKIDVDSHEVHVDSSLIELTALEFRLLRELVDKRGRVQSRDQLLSEVWGYNSEVTTRTVDTHIKRLREKLGSMGKYVQTIRGVGYKFSRTPD